MRKYICAIVAAATCFGTTGLRAEPELKGSAAEIATYLASVPKTTSIMAEAELKVPADRALISLKVVTENKSLREASKANQEVRAKMVKSLSAHGIPAERIVASKFSSVPKYGVFREKAKGYVIENTVQVTALDEKEFQAVSSLVDELAEVRYEGVQFENADKQVHQIKALAQAIEKVEAKKKIFEEKLGVKLSPRQFVEGQSVVARARTQWKLSSGGTEPSFTGVARAVGVSGVEESEQMTMFNELVYSARLTVEYAVEGK